VKGDHDPNETEFRSLVATQQFLDGITFHDYCFHNGGGPTPSLEQHLINSTLIAQGKHTVFLVLILSLSLSLARSLSPFRSLCVPARLLLIAHALLLHNRNAIL
jgi:hypothetical protein